MCAELIDAGDNWKWPDRPPPSTHPEAIRAAAERKAGRRRHSGVRARRSAERAEQHARELAAAKALQAMCAELIDAGDKWVWPDRPPLSTNPKTVERRRQADTRKAARAASGGARRAVAAAAAAMSGGQRRGDGESKCCGRRFTKMFSCTAAPPRSNVSVVAPTSSTAAERRRRRETDQLPGAGHSAAFGPRLASYRSRAASGAGPVS